MTELVVRVLLDGGDAVVVEVLHVVAGVAEEEVVGTHTEPEEVDLLVRLGRVVVDARDVGRGERTV